MICIPIKQKKISEAIKEVNKAKKHCDILEIWFDEIKDMKEKKLKELFENNKKPIIYKTTTLSKLTKILKFKPQYIDIDISRETTLINEIKTKSPKTKIIISNHNFKKTPSIKEMEKIYLKMKEKKADIFKFAAKANSLIDSLRMLKFLEFLKEKNTKAICVCMGKEGKLTRVSGHIFGNYLMYAPLTGKKQTAEGQIIAKDLKNILKLLK
jgi:3-dehydroquinate dehydratase type I